MELHAIRSYLIEGLNCVRYLAFKVWGYFIIHAVIVELVAAQAPSVTLSNSSVTLRDGGTLQLRCDVENSTNGYFSWKHTPQSGNSNEDYSVESVKELDRVTIYQYQDDIAPTSSLLLISNVSPDDSGTITCKYYYSSPSGTGTSGSNIATNTTSLCVSGKPDPPLCSSAELSQDTLNITCSTNSTDLCSDDINLEFITNGEMLENNQTMNGNNIERLATIPKNQIANAGYMCILRSGLFPDLIRNCSLDFEAMPLPTIAATTDTSTATLLSETDLSNSVTDSLSPTRTETTSNKIINSTVSIATGSGVSSTPTEIKPVTFSLTAVIIAASAAAGGVLFLAMLLCLVIACCKRYCCHTPHEKSDNEADPRMEMRKKSSHSLPLPTLPTVMDEPSTTPNYFVIEQTLDQHEQNQRKDSMPVYATPDKSAGDAPEHLNTDGVKVPPSSSDSYTISGNDLGQYASIYDIDDDRDKVSTPDPVANNYDYASFNLTTTSDSAITSTTNRPDDVNGETEMAEEGFVENSIYNS